MPERNGPKRDIRLAKRDVFDLKKGQGALYGKMHAFYHEMLDELAERDEQIANLELEIDRLIPESGAANSRRGNSVPKVP